MRDLTSGIIRNDRTKLTDNDKNPTTSILFFKVIRQIASSAVTPCGQMWFQKTAGSLEKAPWFWQNVHIYFICSIQIKIKRQYFCKPKPYKNTPHFEPLLAKVGGSKKCGIISAIHIICIFMHITKLMRSGAGPLKRRNKGRRRFFFIYIFF